MVDRAKNILKLIGIFAAVLAAVFLFGCLSTGTIPKIVTNDQNSISNSVLFTQIVTTQNGWIAIHADSNGSPGDIIGFAKINQGDNNNVRVDINVCRATQTLIAMLHTDAGQIGVFEYPGADSPLLYNNQMITQNFKLNNFNDLRSQCSQTVVTASISVLSQTIADNNSVTIQLIVSPGRGWVVIQSDTNEEIGYAALTQGNNSNVSIQIDKSKSTQNLTAQVRTDAGQIGVYEPSVDAPIIVNNTAVQETFQVTNPDNNGGTDNNGTDSNQYKPMVNVSDQNIINGQVIVDEIDTNTNSWIEIHADENGSPGNIIGYSQVGIGRDTNVVVDVNTNQATETLYAMLHIDAGMVGVYEFPGADMPIEIDGNIVQKEFTVTNYADLNIPDLNAPIDQNASDQNTTDQNTMLGVASVEMRTLAFFPPTLSINPGTTVTWVNRDNVDHAVVGDGFSSGTIAPGETYEYTFDTEGDYNYYCSMYPSMTGTISVSNPI
jgi:plastocyanin